MTEFKGVNNQTNLVMNRMERKIVLPAHLSGFLIAWLRHHFPADRLYPENLVHSLYFDTPDLASYHECLDGDIYKNKIRLRWYNRPQNGKTVKAFIEVKSKRGFNTVKRRKGVEVPGEVLLSINKAGLRETLRILEILPELGYVPTPQLQPIIYISYRRFRFKYPEGDMSTTYDFDVCSRIIMPGVAGWAPFLRLKPTVLELKGHSLAIPPVFRDLNYLDLQWSTFSKYAQCLSAHLEKPGATESLPVLSSYNPSDD